MLQYRAIHPEALGLLKELSKIVELESFFLVGGTALALRFGHRLSVDLDFFTVDKFQPDVLLEILRKYQIATTNKGENTLSMVIQNVHVDFIRHRYPLIHDIELIDNIRMASTADIAAMKLNGITNRGAKKDFFDIYQLLKTLPLGEMLDYYSQKYGNGSEYMVLKSLTYFEDANDEPEPELLGNVSWEKVKTAIVSSVRNIF